MFEEDERWSRKIFNPGVTHTYSGFAGSHGYSYLGEPQVALCLVTRFVTDPICGTRRGHTQAGSLPHSHGTTSSARTSPHALREHRRRHPRVLPPMLTDGCSTPLIPESCWRSVSADCLRDGVRGHTSRAAINLIDSPSARCNRRIRAQSSTVITHPIVWNRWLSFQAVTIAQFRPSPTGSPGRLASSQVDYCPGRRGSLVVGSAAWCLEAHRRNDESFDYADRLTFAKMKESPLI